MNRHRFRAVITKQGTVTSAADNFTYNIKKGLNQFIKGKKYKAVLFSKAADANINIFNTEKTFTVNEIGILLSGADITEAEFVQYQG